MKLQLRRVASVVCRGGTPKDFDMHQTFDWIFFAIVVLPTAFLIWDWLKNR